MKPNVRRKLFHGESDGHKSESSEIVPLEYSPGEKRFISSSLKFPSISGWCIVDSASRSRDIYQLSPHPLDSPQWIRGPITPTGTPPITPSTPSGTDTMSHWTPYGSSPMTPWTPDVTPPMSPWTPAGNPPMGPRTPAGTPPMSS